MLGGIVIVLWMAVGHGLTAILDPMTAMRDDISRIKVMMETVGERMERFNDLYLNKLETRLLTSATSMAHIDSNVKNIQERAHVWDTFQLHVSAWNEQIKSLDKKLDILNRGAEKWELLDEKVVSLLPLDYKLTKVMEKLEETDAKVTEIQRKLNSSGPPSPTPPAPPVGEAPLFSEFTSRGVLSALKDIEIKVNKIADKTLHSPSVPATSTTHFGSVVTGNKNKEDIQQKTLEVVNDVAGKVDFILDKMVVKRHSGKQQSSNDESVEEGGSTMYDDDSDYSPENAGAIQQAEKSFAKLWRRMLQPVRRANKKFDSLDKLLAQLDRVTNASLLRRDADKPLRDDVASLLECCRTNDVGIRGLAKSVESLAARPQPSCVIEADLQLRLQETQTSVVRQLSDFVKDTVGAGVDRVRHTCSTAGGVHHRKKYSSAGSQNGTLTHPNEEGATEGSIKAASGDRRSADSSVESPIVVTTPASTETKTGLRGCHDLRLSGETESRIYSLASGKELNEGGRDYNTRFCDMTTDGGGWTVIQRRGDFGDLPRENFSVGWREYKLGFGHLEREFWFGNDFIHRLTNEHDVVLRVELWDFDDQSVFAEYESFRVDSEEDLYRLWVEGYQGNATDSLGSHNGYAFSTFDRDNDEAPPCCPCAPAYGGGWWFYSCFEANLNGEYHTNPTENDYYRGIIWELWRGDYSLRRAELKIRPHDFVAPRPPPPTSTSSTLSFNSIIGGDDIPEDP